MPRKIQSLFLVWTILYIIDAKFQPIGTGVAKLTNHIEVWLHDLVSWKKKRVDLKISNWFKLNQLDQTFKQTLPFIKHSRGKYNSLIGNYFGTVCLSIGLLLENYKSA